MAMTHKHAAEWDRMDRGARIAHLRDVHNVGTHLTKQLSGWSGLGRVHDARHGLTKTGKTLRVKVAAKARVRQ